MPPAPSTPTTDKRVELARRIQREQIGGDLADKLQNGIPTIGWEGSPNLMPVHNKLLDAFEVYDIEHGLERAQLICSWQMWKGPPPLDKLIIGLMERDQSRVSIEEQVAEIDRHNEAIEADIDRRHADRMEEADDAMEYAVHRDIGGFRRRVY